MTEFEKADLDGSGSVSKTEWDTLALEDRRRVLDDADAMRDAQRRMTWFALSGMLLYPLAIVLCSFLGLEQATKSLSSIAGVYFVSVSALVGAFFGLSKIGGK